MGPVIENPVVSIVINNYNYAHYLTQAIESALAQTWPRTEVIVVDDGSTDDSRQVVAGFEQDVIPILKHNEGQASTFNAGFERSRGEIVVFLDADDALLPHAVEQAVGPLQEDGVVKVHWPMWEMDADGNNLGRLHKGTLIEGDFRDVLIRRGPISLTQSPTSGNAWARWFLDRVMPLPEHADKHGSDGFLKKLCPIFGEIRRIDEPQGLYRIHPANYGGGRGPAFELRRGLRRYPAYCRLLAGHLQRMGVPFDLAGWIGPRSQYTWLRNFVLAFDGLVDTVPRNETVVLVDNEDLGTAILPGRHVLSFQEHDGDYQGLPDDAPHAIEQLARMRAAGAGMLVLAFSGFWWLDTYPDLFEHLRAHHHCLLDNDQLVVFDLRRRAPTVSEGDKAGDRHTLRDGRSVADVCRTVFGLEPERVRILGEGSNRCRAFKVRIGNEAVKCFECDDAPRAEEVRRASEMLRSQGISMPRILDVVGHVVLAEWVKGQRLTGGASLYSKMAAYQARIHGARISADPVMPGRFPHLEWLLDRLKRATARFAPPVGVDALADRILALIPERLKPGIVQPDFIKANIVETPAGDLVIVDNEFLGFGVGFEFDVLNTCRAVSAGDETRQQRYMAAYEAAGDRGSLVEHAEFWEICYLTKLTGKRFAIGDDELGTVCLELLTARVEACGRAGDIR